jgi:hypothetical protein
MHLRQLFAALVALCALVGQSYAARPDLNAFLNRKVVSDAGLVHQVRTDNEVMDRYVRHFSMTRQEVIEYLSQLHVGHLKAPLTTSVYSVPDGGRIKVHQQSFPKGTLVFADPQQTPVLLVKCGNPLTLGPHAVSAMVSAPMLKGASAENFKPLTEPGLNQESPLPTDALALEPPSSLNEQTAETGKPTVLSPPDTQTPDKSPVDVPPTRPQGFGFGNPAPGIAGLGGLIGVFSLLSVGSGGSHHAQAVPEPVGLVILAPVAAAFLLKRRPRG